MKRKLGSTLLLISAIFALTGCEISLFGRSSQEQSSSSEFSSIDDSVTLFLLTEDEI